MIWQVILHVPSPWFKGKFVHIVRQAQIDVEVPNAVKVDAKGLPLNPDGIHLTTAAQIRLANMLADAFLSSNFTPPTKTQYHMIWWWIYVTTININHLFIWTELGRPYVQEIHNDTFFITIFLPIYIYSWAIYITYHFIILMHILCFKKSYKSNSKIINARSWRGNQFHGIC